MFAYAAERDPGEQDDCFAGIPRAVASSSRGGAEIVTASADL
jgi:hypothetical protein